MTEHVESFVYDDAIVRMFLLATRVAASAGASTLCPSHCAQEIAESVVRARPAPVPIES